MRKGCIARYDEMLLKRLFAPLFFFLLVSATPAFSQDASQTTGADRKEIEKTLEIYLQATFEKDYEELMNYLHPGLFEFASREALIENFKTMSEEDRYTMLPDSVAILTISDIFEHNVAKYALVEYFLRIKFVIAEKHVSGLWEGMKDMLIMQYGEDKVQVDAENRTFTIVGINSLYSISNPAFEGWKFLENKGVQPFIIDEIIPLEVQEHFRKIN